MNPSTYARELRGTRATDLLLAALEGGGEISRSAAEENIGDALAVGDFVQKLSTRGLLRKDTSIVGEITLTGLGREVAEYIKYSREHGRDRREAVQRGILRWVSLNPNAASVQDLVGEASATAFGIELTEEEIAAEAKWLSDNGLLSGVHAWGQALLRPEITSLGRDVLDADTAPSDYLRRDASFTHVDNSNQVDARGSTNLAFQQGGSQNSLTVQQTSGGGWQEEFLEAFEGIVSKLRRDIGLTEEELLQVEEVRGEVQRDSAEKGAAAQKTLTWAASFARHPAVLASLPELLRILG